MYLIKNNSPITEYNNGYGGALFYFSLGIRRKMLTKIKDKLLLYTVFFLVGGCLYSTIEIVYRQHTHISMFFAGGLCLTLIAFTDYLTPRLSFFLKAVLCGLVITAVELVFGLVFNVLLGLDVWNYSGEPLNLFGQICLPFTLIWVFVSIPALLLTRLTREMLSEKT